MVYCKKSLESQIFVKEDKMIVKKIWMKRYCGNKDLGLRMTKEVHYMGLYLFGIIPFWIEQTRVNYQ
jgi:hypothetical protein